MSHVEVVDKFCQDGWFVVEVEWFQDDGSFWYMEHYRWLCEEGHKQKRATNSDGEILLASGLIAPFREPTGSRHDIPTQYLPDGEEWMLLPAPRMDDGSIWDTILTVHEKRVALGTPGGRDVLPRTPLSLRNVARVDAGGEILITRYKDVVGDVVVL